MIFLNFIARSLAFHVLLIPVITVLGAMVLLILVRLKRAPAALRAGISGAALIVVLVLPWVATTVPKVTIPIFSAIPDAQTESLDRHLPPPGVILPPPDSSRAPAPRSELTSSSELSKASPTIKSPSPRLNWRVLLAAVVLALVCAWILGVTWGFVFLMLGMVGIIRLRWSSHLVTDTRLIEALRSSCERLNYRGSVLFLISDQIALPITWGLLRAKIALPKDALNWPAERIDAALLHELAHIKRHDFAIQTLSRFACVFHWYNPLVLRLFRAWKSDAEQACDDLVLRSGYSGARYSDILLEVWRSATIPRPQSSLGLAMVRSSTLEQRVVAILDPERKREEVSPRKQKQLLALFGGITILIAVISLTRPTNYHLTPELQNDMQAILRQVQTQEDTHLSIQLGLERQQEYWSSAKRVFEPQPQPTVANITLELTGAKVRYRAHYHPSVNRWIHGSAPFYIESKTDVSDGESTWTILAEHHDNSKWHGGGGIGFLAGFGYRADDQVRTVINGLEGNGFTPFNGASYGIERAVLNGAPAVRVQDIFTTVVDAQRRTWWFDPQRDYALIQYELADFNGGSTQPTYLEVTSVQQLQKLADGVWYPTQFSTLSSRYVNGQLTDDSFRSSTKITSLVSLLSVNPSIFQTLPSAPMAIPPNTPTEQNSPPQGKILNASGTPVANASNDSSVKYAVITVTLVPPPGVVMARVIVQNTTQDNRPISWAQAAEENSLRASLPPGDYLIRAVGRDKSGLIYFSAPKTLNVSTEPINISMELLPSYHFVGSIDASVPRPIKKGMVVGCVTTDASDAKWNHGPLVWTTSSPIQPDGSFILSNLPEPQKPMFGKLPVQAGQLEVIAMCDGFVSRSGHVENEVSSLNSQTFDAPVVVPLAIPMEPTGSIRVELSGPDNKPLAGIPIEFSPNQSFNWISNILGTPMDKERYMFGDPSIGEGRPSPFKAVTDKNGVAIVDGLPSGKELLNTEDETYVMPMRPLPRTEFPSLPRSAILPVTAGAQTTAKVKLILKGSDMASRTPPFPIKNSDSPDGRYAVSIEPADDGYGADPQQITVTEKKTGKLARAFEFSREFGHLTPSDNIKIEWNSTSFFFVVSLKREGFIDACLVNMDNPNFLGTINLHPNFSPTPKILSYQFTGEYTLTTKSQLDFGPTQVLHFTIQKDGNTVVEEPLVYPQPPRSETSNHPPDSRPQGKVLDANGEAVANAKISLVPAGRLMTITDGQIDSGTESILSTPDGGFTLNQPGVTGDLLVAVNERGYGVIPWEKFSETVTLTAWASVSGTVSGESMPAAQKSVEFQVSIPLNPRIATEGQVRLLSRATVDSQGSFLATHVPVGIVNAMLAAGPLSNQRSLLDQHSLVETIHIETQADQTARADFGGRGITVTGKAEMPNDPDLDLNWGQIFWAQSPIGLNIPSGMPQDQADKLTREYYASDAGKKALLATRVEYFHIQPDGSFKIENVSPGSYELRVDFIHKPAQGGRNWSVGNTSASVEVKAGDTSIEVPLLKLHLLPKPPNSTTSNDARNPSLPASLQMEGEKLTIDQIAALQQKIANDPSDLPDRVRILGYYFIKRISESSAQNAAQPHLLWVIRNFPASAIAGDPIASVDYRTDLPHYEEASETWKEALAKYPNDPQVIGNAAAFYLLNEPERAEKLLLQGQKLEPNNTGWAMRLGQLYTLRSMGPDTSVKTASKAEALKWFEQGLSSLKGIDRFYALEAPAKAAFEAGDFATAHQYAQELLQMAPQYPKDWNYGNAIYTGNSILGQIALVQGDIPSAKNFLLAAGDSPGSPQLNSFGPDLTLARELLVKGEKDAVIAFLGKIAKFWKGHEEKIQDWQKTIQQGQTTF